MTNVPSVQLTDRALFETGFTWYQRVNGGAWTSLGSVPALAGVGLTQAIVRPYEAPTSYYEYKVVAANSAGTASSNIVSAGQPPPAAPSNVRFPSTTTSSITVAWNDNSSNEDGFAIYTDCCGARSVAANLTSFTLGGLAPGQRVCFQIGAYSGSGTSLSSTACATTQAPHTVQIGLAKAINGSTIYYTQTPLRAGTLTRIHVTSPQWPVTGVYMIKPGYEAKTECASLPPPHGVYAAVGTDVDLVKLYGSATLPIYNQTFSACGEFAQVADVSNLLLDITYNY